VSAFRPQPLFLSDIYLMSCSTSTQVTARIPFFYHYSNISPLIRSRSRFQNTGISWFRSKALALLSMRTAGPLGNSRYLLRIWKLTRSTILKESPYLIATLGRAMRSLFSSDMSSLRTSASPLSLTRWRRKSSLTVHFFELL
jgi:hypothetical protein